ncbi:ATP-binding protein [Desulfosporosinus meridiei]|uniref:histidine kinase n=1 Tax=Desulfosporosinus meridiei (strain ATCC BAA-275 / DSM 13257 / KCTC 12902 / NCIMB 13706 / S10) TaxID=768704 RepID=J7IQ38_DESMD|nr:ATP-binding protein [Desulfosporosinus meridiei]AFQ43967.1 histidine kinase [Desulfosporosinus meridiei DSM 13257]
MGDLKRRCMWLSSAGIILILIYYLPFVSLNVPYIGLNVVENEAGKWQISNVDHLGWANQQGIKAGDTVALINQNKPSEHFTVSQYGIIEQAETLTINKSDELILYKVTNTATQDLIWYHILIPGLVFGILFIFSLFLYIKKRDDKAALLLILFFIAIGFSYLSSGASARIDILGIYINRITLSLIPVLFLEFLRVYFLQHGLILYSRRLLFALYGINGLLLVILSLFQIFGGRLSIIRYSFLAVFSVSILLCFYIIISRYMRYRNTVHKPVFKIIIVGFILSFFPFVVLVGLPSILFGVELIPGALGAVFLVFLPVVFLYLITAKSLFDIDFIISRIRYYSIICLIPTTLFLLIVIYIVREITFLQGIHVGLVAYIGIIVFLYIKEELDFSFRSKLFREKYNFQASLDRFSQTISRVMKPAELEEELIIEVMQVLPVKSISLFAMDLTDNSLVIKKGDPNYPTEENINWLNNNIRSISVGELIDIDSEVLLIVSKAEDKIHLVWIREKQNRTSFNQHEKVWLRTIASYASLVYENLRLIEGLTVKLEEAVSKKDPEHPWVMRLLFNLSEKERRRLALDLHDSALQHQLLWYRKLEIILEDEKIPEDLKKQLNNLAEGMLDVTHQIRETCNELFPPLLRESGIVEALKNLFANAQLRTNYVVNFDSKDFSMNLDYEHVLALYRIVQELLTNAAKHSKATEVNISLSNSNDILEFRYQDNGIGIDLNNLKSSLSHMGLSGIKERVSSLGGNTSLHSSLGKGLEVSICMVVEMMSRVSEQVV